MIRLYSLFAFSVTLVFLSGTQTHVYSAGDFDSSANGIVPKEAWFPKAPAIAKPAGQTIRVETVEELFQAAQEVRPSGTILVADGHYWMPRCLDLTTDNITLRSESGDRHRVIFDGARGSDEELLGELVAISRARGVTIADLTIQNVRWNGFKINSDRGADQVTIYNCVIHNVWQRGVKAPAMNKKQGPKQQANRNCCVEYCLFYNDRAKKFSDDETDTPETFNGNYIGGIDVKSTVDWTISNNVFLGIQGRTREGRAGIYISENGRRCTIERNVFIDCDIAIALGNPSLGYSPLQATDCVASNNFISNCPETGILACYTSGCQILNNTIYEPGSQNERLIWIQKSNNSLRVQDNLLVGAEIKVTSSDAIEQSGNVVFPTIATAMAQSDTTIGQNFLPVSLHTQAIELNSRLLAKNDQAELDRLKAGIQREEVLAAMRKVHAGFSGQRGRVAQFGDSITYSMAFWTPLGWGEPQRYLTSDDGLPKKPDKMDWSDYIKGSRDKGPKYANYSGWRVEQVLQAMEATLESDKPEVAIIMVGTNDIKSGHIPDHYRENLERVINNCLSAQCIPILNTIPPCRNRDNLVGEVNTIIRDVATKMSVPLADFHAECVRLRPGGTWDGTLISNDGVHPSGGLTHDYSEENLRNCGYALRNWVNFLAYRQLYFHVLAPQQ